MQTIITFACGHQQTWAHGESPECKTCGSTTIVRVSEPRPRFRGDVRGPCAVES
jgi:hypothetical protein